MKLRLHAGPGNIGRGVQVGDEGDGRDFVLLVGRPGGQDIAPGSDLDILQAERLQFRFKLGGQVLLLGSNISGYFMVTSAASINHRR
jgi:hypothetical protein